MEKIIQYEPVLKGYKLSVEEVEKLQSIARCGNPTNIKHSVEDMYRRGYEWEAQCVEALCEIFGQKEE